MGSLVDVRPNLINESNDSRNAFRNSNVNISKLSYSNHKSDDFINNEESIEEEEIEENLGNLASEKIVI